MGKPVERQNHTVSFFILASLIALCTAWAFYEEFLGRRPWKDYQERTFGYEKEKAASELRAYQRKLESGELKVVLDPSKPEETTTVAEAQKRLEEIDRNLAKEHREVDQVRSQLKEAEIEASDADMKVKLLKSEDDGLFYQVQNAEHEEALANNQARALREQGKQSEAESEQHKADSWKKKREEAERDRAHLAEQIRKAEVATEDSAKKLSAVQGQLKDKIGERERIKAAIDAAQDPILTAKSQLEATSKKSAELTQYWLTTYDNSVDRCQNCHELVDKCGYSRPHEILEALAAPNAKAEEIPAKFCINQERLESYQQTAAEVCAFEFDAEASAKGDAGKGRCLSGDERTAVRDFFLNYCGPQSAAQRILGDRGLKSACMTQENWEKLADYVEPLEKRGACAIELKPEGETCLEGARRDQVLAWVRDHCSEVSATRKGLEKNAKACASGDAGKKLASIKPVLFNYEVWAQTHPYRLELLGNNHPPDQLGCTSCHEGQGAQTKGVARREYEHGWDDHYWEKPMLDLVSHKKYRPITFSAPASDQGVPGEWAQNEKEFVQSTCAKCHTEAVQLKFADTYTKGRRLVGEVGCHGCHPIDAFKDFPKIGPTLTDLRKKTTPTFLMTWVSYPKSFRPRTKMPNFWPEALNPDFTVRQGSPEASQRADEVTKIAAALWKAAEGAELPPLPMKGDPGRGKALTHRVGCRGCHAFVAPGQLCTPEQLASGKSRGTPQEPGECEGSRTLSGSDARDFAPNLSNIAQKTNERWLFAWLKNPRALWAQTRMPNLRLSDGEAADIVAYLMTLKEGPALKAAPAVFDNPKSPQFAAAAAAGDALITKYGCPGCHDIKGHENDAKIGAELNEFGRKAVDLLDFGNAIPNPRHHTWYNWIDLKLRAPRSYRYERVDTRMPQFDFTDAEVDEIMTFLKSRYSEKTPHAYLADADERHAAIAHGDQLLDYYNCRGCHVIDFQGGAIRDVYAEDDIYKAPPILQQEGWRVQPEWMFGFIHDPSTKLRPWLDVRMPTFPLTDERVTTLVHSFAARANVAYPYLTANVPQMSPRDLSEARTMVDEQLKCFKCHTAGAPSKDQDPASLAPDLELAKRRLRPDWVEAWLKNPQSLQEGTRMPNFFTPDNFSTVMYPKYFGGSQERQIRALRDFVMTLPDAKASKPQAASKPPAKKKRASLDARAGPEG